MLTTKAPPLIITAELEPSAFQRFNGLRQQYFPPERNHLPAHITLFHKLPPEHHASILQTMQDAVSEHVSLEVLVTGVARFGQGVGYRLASQELLELRQSLARHFQPWLSAQDAQIWHPHITVQNKVAQKIADQTFCELNAKFSLDKFLITGLLLWEYLGGPWRLLSRTPLAYTTS